MTISLIKRFIYFLKDLHIERFIDKISEKIPDLLFLLFSTIIDIFVFLLLIYLVCEFLDWKEDNRKIKTGKYYRDAYGKVRKIRKWDPNYKGDD